VPAPRFRRSDTWPPVAPRRLETRNLLAGESGDLLAEPFGRDAGGGFPFGATTHGDPRQREIDLRRDALLATVGILVVRFAHRRLVHEPHAVRRETRTILATRRGWVRLR
jgi:hypothetical protein